MDETIKEPEERRDDGKCRDNDYEDVPKAIDITQPPPVMTPPPYDPPGVGHRDNHGGPEQK